MSLLTGTLTKELVGVEPDIAIMTHPTIQFALHSSHSNAEMPALPQLRTVFPKGPFNV
jgi:hypothetical protein